MNQIFSFHRSKILHKGSLMSFYYSTNPYSHAYSHAYYPPMVLRPTIHTQTQARLSPVKASSKTSRRSMVDVHVIPSVWQQSKSVRTQFSSSRGFEYYSSIQERKNAKHQRKLQFERQRQRYNERHPFISKKAKSAIKFCALHILTMGLSSLYTAIQDRKKLIRIG
jgi:hypothetical protein